MFKQMRSFICGFIFAFILTVIVFASNKIDVVFNGITVLVNGIKIEKENILYEGTTYIPIRAVAEALNKDVDFNNETKTAEIKDKITNVENIGGNKMYDDLKVYEFEGVEYIKARELYDLKLKNIGYNIKNNNKIAQLVTTKKNIILDNMPYEIFNNYTYITLQYYKDNIEPLIK